MSIFWNFDKFSDVKIRTFFQKRDSSNFSSNSNSTVTIRLAYFFWDLLDTWKVKNCVSWNTLVIKNLCLSPQSLRQIENWSFFSWLRSLLKLRENLRKYSEFLSPWFYSRHFANLNFSSAWCYSGKIIIPCTRLFDQQDRLNCKIYPKSREKS